MPKSRPPVKQADGPVPQPGRATGSALAHHLGLVPAEQSDHQERADHAEQHQGTGCRRTTGSACASTAGRRACAGRTMWARSMVAATAATAQRDGTSQASWSRPGCRTAGAATPQKTTWTIASSTSSGMVFSAVLTSAETTRPSIIEVKPSSADDEHHLGQRRGERPGRSSAACAAARPITESTIDLHHGDQAEHDDLGHHVRGPGQADRAFALVDHPFLDQLADRVGGAGEAGADREHQQHRAGVAC